MTTVRVIPLLSAMTAVHDVVGAETIEEFWDYCSGVLGRHVGSYRDMTDDDVLDVYQSLKHRLPGVGGGVA